MQDVKIQLLLH